MRHFASVSAVEMGITHSGSDIALVKGCISLYKFHFPAPLDGVSVGAGKFWKSKRQRTRR
jgi:hypothetical protein